MKADSRAMENLFAPFALFQQFPFTALLPALLFLALLLVSRRGDIAPPKAICLKLFAAMICWAAYALWEYRIQIWAETVTAPIRVDLLLIYPALTLLTLWSLVAWWRYKRSVRQ